MVEVLLILSVVIGALVGAKFGRQKVLAKNLLIFAAGFLIAICLNEVFPSVYSSGIHGIGIFVIAGVLLQLVLESLTKGFEHGHIHHGDSQGILPLSLMIGLVVHAFIEGIPLAENPREISPYLLGILFHNLPSSFVLGAFLFGSKKIKFGGMLTVALFAIASPLGMWLGRFFDASLQPYFLAVVGGIFLHIASVIIFESNKNHNIDWQKILLVVSGIALALLSHNFHYH